MDTTASVLQVLIGNVIEHLKQEISLIRDLEKDAEKLSQSMDTIQKFLNDAEMQTIPSEAVKSWLKRLEDVAFDADNVLDKLNYHLLVDKIKIMKPIKKRMVSSCLPMACLKNIIRKRNMGAKINEISIKFESINKDATGLGLQQKLTEVRTLPAAASETDSTFPVDSVFVGRDDDVPLLSEILTKDKRRFFILPIVGMPGMGKTTLAKKVHHDPKICTQFQSRVWVHVSKNFDPIILFKKILKILKPTAECNDAESRENILAELRGALKARTHLLVLDDVWNEDVQTWQDFISSLLGVTSTMGNAIIITTRSGKVASTVQPHHIHKLKGLSTENCWSIMKAKSFGKSDVPSTFEAIGRKIAEKCGGLPLAATVVGAILHNQSEQKWHSIEQNWLSDDEDNITKIFALGVDRLSLPSLKKCFAYCSVIPKGGGLVKQELIELWMAEGFLQADGSNDMESVGDNYFNILLRSSFLQDAWGDDYENATVCVMHDLVHNWACSMLDSSKIRYMSYGESNPIPKDVAKYLRTLFFHGQMPGAMFSDLKSLRALTLRSYLVEELPSSIGELIHLRNLNISKTAVESLPDSIGKLHHLQTLRADGRPFRKLPSAATYLINLRHLYIHSKVELPTEIGRLNSLQTLTHFPVGSKINGGCSIEELGSLNNLKGKLEICNLEEVDDKEEAERAKIDEKSNLSKLELTWGADREGETNDESVLEGLQPHHDLKGLKIWGFRGKKFPSWTLNMAVQNVPQRSWVGLNLLTEIRLYHCQECEEIPTVGHLPNLKSLKLEGLSNVMSINSSFYGIGEGTSAVFAALERLELVKMDNLREWADVELIGTSTHKVRAFPRLSYLKIKDCMELMSAPSYYKTQSLLTLKVSNCNSMAKLPDGLHTLTSLEVLTIKKCPNLKWLAAHSISSGKGKLQAEAGKAASLRLRVMKICECPEVTELPCDMIESSAPSLEILNLKGLSSVDNLPRVIDSLAEASRLIHLRIVGIPTFVATTLKQWSPSFPNMRVLDIDASVKGSKETSDGDIRTTVDGLFRGCCHSLYKLYLKGMEFWDLPESMQLLTSTFSLTIENFGIQELPQWFMSVLPLRELRLSNCTRLTRESFMDTVRRLAGLQTVYVDRCPLLGFQRQQIIEDRVEIIPSGPLFCDPDHPDAMLPPYPQLENGLHTLILQVLNITDARSRKPI